MSYFLNFLFVDFFIILLLLLFNIEHSGSQQHYINFYHTLLWKQVYSTPALYSIWCTVTYCVFSVFHCDSQSISNPQSILQWGTLSFLILLRPPSLFVFPSPSSFLPLYLSHFPSQEDCQTCLPGYYCDAVGLSAPSGECWEGFFCLEGADRPDPPLRDSRGGPCPKGENICPKKMHEDRQ